jgi:hypothetical protein
VLLDTLIKMERSIQVPFQVCVLTHIQLPAPTLFHSFKCRVLGVDKTVAVCLRLTNAKRAPQVERGRKIYVNTQVVGDVGNGTSSVIAFQLLLLP